MNRSILCDIEDSLDLGTIITGCTEDKEKFIKLDLSEFVECNSLSCHFAILKKHPVYKNASNKKIYCKSIKCENLFKYYNLDSIYKHIDACICVVHKDNSPFAEILINLIFRGYNRKDDFLYKITSNVFYKRDILRDKIMLLFNKVKELFHYNSGFNSIFNTIQSINKIQINMLDF